MNTETNKNTILTFEMNERDQILEIHTDETGINRLLELLVNLNKKKEPDHIHLMTANWGGEELTPDKIGDENIAINHVKIFKW